MSVVVPLFGEHRGHATLAAVCAAWAAQDTPCEVVVGTAGAVPTPASPERPRVVRADPSSVSPGRLRNEAAARATGEWLYLSDADVVPVGSDYLSRALRLADDGAMAQPWMFRIMDGGFAVNDLRRMLGQPLGGLVGSGCCSVRPTADGRTLEPDPWELFAWDGDTPMVVAREDPETSAVELHWRAPFHWGGLLVRREVFTAVGGYWTGYRGWGCEDDDLLVKLRSRTAVVVAWRADRSLHCAHFEHPRPYDTSAYATNQAWLARRVAAGAQAMIESDVRDNAGCWPR